MNRQVPWKTWVLCIALGCAAPVAGHDRSMRNDETQASPARAPLMTVLTREQQTEEWNGEARPTQRSGPPGAQGGGGRSRGGRRRDNPNQKNNATIKAAYRVATAEAGKATVEVLGDDKVVALGTVVDPQGYIVTKASLLEGKISCRLAGREALDAKLVTASQEHDLALLKVEASDLATVAWRAEPVVPGTLVAAVAPGGDAIGIGVISAEARAVADPYQRKGWRAFMGIELPNAPGEVSIVRLHEGGPAAKAGLKVGDQIQSIDGTAMQSRDQIISTVRGHAPGDKLVIVLQRDAEQLTKEVVVAKPPMQGPEDEWGGGPFSALRDGFPRVLPHDTVIRPEQCGGPLVDTDGKVVGVNIARALRVTTYAIPAEIVQQFVATAK